MISFPLLFLFSFSLFIHHIITVRIFQLPPRAEKAPLFLSFRLFFYLSIFDIVWHPREHNYRMHNSVAQSENQASVARSLTQWPIGPFSEKYHSGGAQLSKLKITNSHSHDLISHHIIFLPCGHVVLLTLLT